MRRQLDKNIALYLIVVFVATLAFCVLYDTRYPYGHKNLLFAYFCGQMAGTGWTLIISGLINNYLYRKAMRFDKVENKEYTQIFDDPKKMEDADKLVKDLHRDANESIKKFDKAADEHSKLTDELP